MDRLACDRMFVAVMEAGSFVAAAERLGTSPAQASKLVSRLESELGVRLFNRTTRAVAPTEAGRAYYARLRPLLEEFDALDQAVRSSTQTPKGRIRLTAPLTFGVVELTPALTVFASRYPDIELDVSFSDRVVNLVEEGFDLAVRIGHPVDSSLVIRKLCSVRIVVVATPDYLERHGMPDSPDALVGHHCIIDTNFRDPNRWPFRHPEGGEWSVPITGRLRFSNAEACLRAAEAGLGLACLPDFVADAALRAGTVRSVLQAFETEPYGVYAVYPHSRHLAAKIRHLVDFLADRYRHDGR